MSRRVEFWDNVPNRGDGCWEWTGKFNNGYGRCGMRYAHRVSWELANGPIPAGSVIRHTCDNPPCVNPAHLEIGTQLDNVEDMRVRGRARWSGVHGERVGTAKLTEDQVREIRSLREAGLTLQGIADRIGISKRGVLRVLQGETWRRVG